MSLVGDANEFKHPFTMIVSGSTGSGKTEWLVRFLNHLEELCAGVIAQVLYCYGELNERILQLQQIGTRNAIHYTVHSGAPTEDYVQKMAEESGRTLLVVLDDLMVGISQALLDTLFTRGSHNWGASVILVTQHLFTKELRTARNNSHYLVLMRNPAGELQIRNLATQLFPARARYFMEAYRDATAKQFSYLLVDMHPSTADSMRLKTNIYPGELTAVYVPQ